jgi:multiple RNA-binding domain-containing protein 1
LAYRKYKHQPLYIEWAPVDVISKTLPGKVSKASRIKQISSLDPISVGEMNSSADFGTLFVKNLSFSTTEDGIRQHCINMGCRSQNIRAVSIPKTRKGDAVLSMGYGFIEFCNLDEMQAALKLLNESVLDSRALEAKPSEKRISVVSSVSVRTSKTPQQKNDAQAYKLIVRNLAFQANQKELLSLFSTFGQVKKVRIPKKVGGQHRGFAFVDYATHQEALNAMTALSSSHLYGRHLVIEWAKDDEEDIDLLRKRAKIDAAAITVDKKRRKDEVKAIEAGAEEDNIDEGDL